MADPDDLDFASLGGATNVVGIGGPTQWNFDAMNLRAGALGNQRHALGKCAVHGDDRLVARFQRIDHRSFDAAGAGSRQRKGDAIVGLENAPQQFLRFRDDRADKPRVHVPDKLRGKGAIDTWVDRCRPGRHHQSRRGAKLAYTVTYTVIHLRYSSNSLSPLGFPQV